VFRSPLYAIADSGLPATQPLLTTAIQIFENFRYPRTFGTGSGRNWPKLTTTGPPRPRYDRF
jgi:hypothetical protein